MRAHSSLATNLRLLEGLARSQTARRRVSRILLRCLVALALSSVGLIAIRPLQAATLSEDTSDPANAVILIEGEINPGDEAKFRSLAMKHDRAVVFLDSPGGRIVPSMEIGKAIRLKEFATAVLPRTTCASACALIWVAGSERFAYPSSRIGFHASYREVGGRQEEAGVGNAIVGRYLTQLNLPERAVIFATVASPDDIQWLDMTSGNASGIDFTLITEDDDEAGSAAAPPASVSASEARANYKFEWRVSPWGVRGGENGCTLLSVFDSEDGQSNISSFVVHAYGDGNTTIMVMNEKFRSLRAGDQYSVKVFFESDSGTSLDAGYQQATAFVPTGDAPKGFKFDLPTERILSPLTRYDSVTFYREGRQVDRFSLRGSSGAVSALRRCLMDLPME